LNPADIRCFQWYVTTVSDTPELRAYAEREGYKDVLALADEFRKLAPEATIPHAMSAMV